MLKKVLVIAVFLPLALGSVATPLRISLPPLMGAVPVALGVSWGLFQQEGVEVELVPLPGQRDRMVAFQARQVDALVTDLASALMLASQMPDEVAIVSTAYFPVSQEVPHLALITQAYSGVKELSDFVAEGGDRFRIAVPRQSDLEFCLEKLFESHGLLLPADRFIGQDDLLINATWVVFGMVTAGVLPQPYVDYLLHYEFEGKPELVVLSDFAGIPIPPSVIVFQRVFLSARLDELNAFFRAVNRAVERLNSSPREELLATGWDTAVELFFPGLDPETLEPEGRARVEQAINEIYIPIFPRPGPVPQDLFELVREWADAKGYLVGEVEYRQVTTAWQE